MIVGGVEGPAVDTSQHTLTGTMAGTIRQTLKSDLRPRPEIPEVVSIDRDDQAVSGSHGTLRVDTEGGVGIWRGDVAQENNLEN